MAPKNQLLEPAGSEATKYSRQSIAACEATSLNLMPRRRHINDVTAQPNSRLGDWMAPKNQLLEPAGSATQHNEHNKTADNQQSS
jgi:hypothetical protein